MLRTLVSDMEGVAEISNLLQFSFSCSLHNVLPLLCAHLCPLCDGDEVFGGSRARQVAKDVGRRLRLTMVAVD